MLFPVLPRVAGVSFPPLPPAIPDYLGILPIRLHLLAVVVRSPSALAVGLPTHPLVRAVLGWLKRLLAIATATGWQAGSSEVLESPLEENRKQMTRGNFRTGWRCCWPRRRSVRYQSAGSFLTSTPGTFLASAEAPRLPGPGSSTSYCAPKPEGARGFSFGVEGTTSSSRRNSLAWVEEPKAGCLAGLYARRRRREIARAAKTARWAKAKAEANG